MHEQDTMKLIKCLLFTFYCIVTTHAQTEVGDLCLGNGVAGICVTIDYCQEALENLRDASKIQRCGFDGTKPIVCCVTPHLTSLQKCLEYQLKPIKPFQTDPTGIIGGLASEINEFPHMVALGFGNDIQWLCGGALISENYVITAAHCTTTLQLGDVRKIIAGTINLRNPQDGYQMYDVKRAIVHPNYKRPQKYNDIALLELNGNVEISHSVRPICLHRNSALPNQKLTATGYGKIGFINTEKNYDLYKVDLFNYNNTYCKEFYEVERSLPNGILESQLCAGDTKVEKDTCQGDSGGPLHYKLDQFFYLVGVTSFGKSCGVIGIPGVYSRISNYLPWIESIVWK